MNNQRPKNRESQFKRQDEQEEQFTRDKKDKENCSDTQSDASSEEGVKINMVVIDPNNPDSESSTQNDQSYEGVN